MTVTAFSVSTLLWFVLAGFNFAVQLIYFYNDESGRLYRLKKITTPLLLLSGILIVVIRPGGFSVLPLIILFLMGAGEIGIEGSSVVEKRSGTEDKPTEGTFLVMAAGAVFLAVNLLIGVILIIRNPGRGLIAAFGLSAVIISLMLYLCFRIFSPGRGVMTQMVIYASGIAVMLAGVIADVSGGLSRLGLAAAILSLSDSLVLIRMGAEFDKQSAAGFRILLSLLIIILLLYYLYIWLIINL